MPSWAQGAKGCSRHGVHKNTLFLPGIKAGKSAFDRRREMWWNSKRRSSALKQPQPYFLAVKNSFSGSRTGKQPFLTTLITLMSTLAYPPLPAPKKTPRRSGEYPRKSTRRIWTRHRGPRDSPKSLFTNRLPLRIPRTGFYDCQLFPYRAQSAGR